jgi:hypothetical protein
MRYPPPSGIHSFSPGNVCLLHKESSRNKRIALETVEIIKVLTLVLNKVVLLNRNFLLIPLLLFLNSNMTVLCLCFGIQTENINKQNPILKLEQCCHIKSAINQQNQHLATVHCSGDFSVWRSRSSRSCTAPRNQSKASPYERNPKMFLGPLSVG